MLAAVTKCGPMTSQLNPPKLPFGMPTTKLWQTASINGQLGAGLTPATRAATEAGEKDLLECLNGEVEKIKTKTNKGEKTEKAEPATLEEILVFKKRHQVINQYNHQSPFIIS